MVRIAEGNYLKNNLRCWNVCINSVIFHLLLVTLYKIWILPDENIGISTSENIQGVNAIWIGYFIHMSTSLWITDQVGNYFGNDVTRMLYFIIICCRSWINFYSSSKYEGVCIYSGVLFERPICRIWQTLTEGCPRGTRYGRVDSDHCWRCDNLDRWTCWRPHTLRESFVKC